MLSKYDSYGHHVLVKDVIINNARVSEEHLEYAIADGMVNYHKDRYCFAFSNSAFVCYVGCEPFYFEFSQS